MTLQKYIKEVHSGATDWFVDETTTVYNQSRVDNIVDMKEYLSGRHKIVMRESEMYNGKEFYPRKIVLQYAKTILNFQTAYLLQHPVTLTGDEKVVKEFQKVQKVGKYNRVNFQILDKMIKYGVVAEYVYMDGKTIKSKVFDPAESYPVYDNGNELIAFVEHFIIEGVSYWNVFTDEVVEQYDNLGGKLRLKERNANLSGLPIVYVNVSELSATDGHSELTDLISILDAMEDLISKYTDSFYKFMNPIPVAIGQQLKGHGLPTDIIGGGINLDDGSEFKMVGNQLDYQTFQTIYKTLVQSLLDISNTPAVSMNKTDISNLSEVSIKLLFSLANVKAGFNEQFIREGIEQRYNKIRKLLAYRDVTFTDDEYYTLDTVFQYAMPSNDKEIIENLRQLSDMGAISLEEILNNSPYTNDVQMELGRLNDKDKVSEDLRSLAATTD